MIRLAYAVSAISVFLFLAFSVKAQNQVIAVDVYMYGHSYNDTEYLEGKFAGYGPTLEEFGFKVYDNAAEAGGIAFDFDGLSSRECHSDDNYKMEFVSGLPGKACNMIGIRQAKYHPDTNSCKSFQPLTRYPNLTAADVVDNSTAGCGTTGQAPYNTTETFDSPCCGASNCVPTCMEDRLPLATSVCILDYMANDLSRGSDTFWDPTNALYIDAIRDYTAILDHASSYGMRCVVSTGLPNFQWTPIRYENAKFLRDGIISTVLNTRPDHVMLDLLTLYDQYEADNGTQAAHDLYQRSEQEPDGSCATCVHPDDVNNDLGENGYRWIGKHVADVLVGLVKEK
tara:strand:+ start:857 stop:1879 length:1023 start_codon:yes stop_codon:yes gene_type:complete